MSSPIRILVVDDSPLACRMVTEVLEAEEDIEIAGTAADGAAALDMIETVRPDLVTLDVEMPVMDGIETMQVLRERHQKLPVVMFSSLTARGAEATIDALLAGANAYALKPSGGSSKAEALEQVRQDLVPKVRALLTRGAPKAGAAPAPSVAKPEPSYPLRAGSKVRPTVLAIGSSTGGPNALAELLGSLPADFPLPIVIAQHMPPKFTELLAKRLSATTPFRVREGDYGARLVPGEALIAPGGHHMTVEADEDGVPIVRLNQDEPEHSCRPAVDVLFRSLARATGAHTLAVVLTGMGRDGFESSREIVNAGGTVLAQDEASSVVWGMPGFVAKGGLASKVLPISELAGEISLRAHLCSAGETPSETEVRRVG